MITSHENRELCILTNKKTPEGVHAGCVGLSMNYVEWRWKVGRTYRTGAQAAQALVAKSYYFLIFMQTFSS